MTRQDKAALRGYIGRAHRQLWEAAQLASFDRTDDLVEDLYSVLQVLEKFQESLST